MKARAFPLAVACLLAIASRTAGQDVEWEAESLRGLDGLHVIVEGLLDPEQEGGLTKDELQTYLEMRLRQARIPILSESEWLASERAPYLYLNVGVFRTATGGWTHSLELKVYQLACIKGGLEGQKGHLASAEGCSLFTTWDRGGLSTAPGSLPDAVRRHLAGFMDAL